MNTSLHTIMKNDERYPGIDKNWPQCFFVSGLTDKQADELAEHLSNHNAGCDYSWYVVGGEGDN